MTSPYIEREAAKLRLVHPAARRALATETGSSADHDPRDVHFARSQPEGGIGPLESDECIKPVPPVWAFAIAAGCWGIFGLAVAWTLSGL